MLPKLGILLKSTREGTVLPLPAPSCPFLPPPFPSPVSVLPLGPAKQGSKVVIGALHYGGALLVRSLEAFFSVANSTNSCHRDFLFGPSPDTILLLATFPLPPQPFTASSALWPLRRLSTYPSARLLYETPNYLPYRPSLPYLVTSPRRLCCRCRSTGNDETCPFAPPRSLLLFPRPPYEQCGGREAGMRPCKTSRCRRRRGRYQNRASPPLPPSQRGPYPRNLRSRQKSPASFGNIQSRSWARTPFAHPSRRTPTSSTLRNPNGRRRVMTGGGGEGKEKRDEAAGPADRKRAYFGVMPSAG